MKFQACQGFCKMSINVIFCSIPDRKLLHVISACLNRSRLVWRGAREATCPFCQKLFLLLGPKVSLFGTKFVQKGSNDLKPTAKLPFQCFFVKTFSVFEQTILLKYAKI